MGVEMPRAPVQIAQERMNAAASSGDWVEYFAGRRELLRAEDESIPQAPPPEWTTAQPWPEGFAVPRSAASLIKAATSAGWEARCGYSRAFKASVGRGVFCRVHWVGVQARRGGRDVRAFWWAKTDREKLAWSFDGGSVDGRAVERVGDVTGALG